MKKEFLKNKITSVCSGLILFALCFSPAYAVFINEIHYDNAGGDTGEGVELTGAAGQDLAGWSLLFYNGGNGLVYKNYALSGTFNSAQQGVGILAFFVSSIQNGISDGVALVDDAGSVLQFLSYEGRLMANAGAAVGLTSNDIGVAESSTTLVGDSLQLFGNGSDYTDFSWRVASASFGSVNRRQSFSLLAGGGTLTVPEPTSVSLLLFGLLILMFKIRMKNTATLVV